MAAPKIYIIHRENDKRRAQFVEKKYADAGLDYQFIDAIDGHDPKALKAHHSMIPAAFWDEPIIKPGALGCFLSHQKAWQRLLETGEAHAVIAEDDSRPLKRFLNHWPKVEAQMALCDLIFLNDRMSKWATQSFDNLDAAILADRERAHITNAEHRAPGGDGYVISAKAAARLLECSRGYGAICGVDWFMIGACWNILRQYVPDRDEFHFIASYLSDEKLDLRAKIAQKPLFEINKNLQSSINHSETVEITALKAQLEAL